MKGSILLALLAVGGACASDADVAGNYTVALTSRDNGCNISGWTTGAMSAGIGVTITQNSSKLTLTVGGLAGVYLVGALGADGNVYTGGVDGDDFDTDSIGTRAYNTGNCTYTYNSSISGTLNGDALEGVIEYRAADNGNSDCSQVHDCLSYQDFNGTRPPT